MAVLKNGGSCPDRKDRTKSPTKIHIPIEKIHRNKFYQIRDDFQDDEIEKRASVLRETKGDGPYPAPIVVQVDEENWEIIDGTYTVFSYVEAGLKDVECEIIEGTESELLKLAIRRNTKNGIPYTKAEIQAIILRLSKLSPKVPVREIAELVGLGKSRVSEIIKAEKEGLSGSGQNPLQPEHKEFDIIAFVKRTLASLKKHVEFIDESAVTDLVGLVNEICALLVEKGLGRDFLQNIPQSAVRLEEESNDEDYTQ